MRKSLEAQPPTHTRGGVKKEQQRDFSCNHCGKEFIVVVKLRSGKMTRFVRFVVSKWRLRLCESVSPDNASLKKCIFPPLKCKKKYFWLFSSFCLASISTQQQESEDISVFFSACHRQKPLHLGKASEKCN